MAITANLDHKNKSSLGRSPWPEKSSFAKTTTPAPSIYLSAIKNQPELKRLVNRACCIKRRNSISRCCSKDEPTG
jgi:hypothetical protein